MADEWVVAKPGHKCIVCDGDGELGRFCLRVELAPRAFDSLTGVCLQCMGAWKAAWPVFLTRMFGETLCAIGFATCSVFSCTKQTNPRDLAIVRAYDDKGEKLMFCNEHAPELQAHILFVRQVRQAEAAMWPSA